jgi:transcriptional regulator with XRE-family HTH domain
MQQTDTSIQKIDAQRRQLSSFLKSCRARLSPTAVGLPDNRRRRTPGLRREDVAALARVSVTWYTWLEQGRTIQVSTDLLERLSATLRMSPDEREYLFSLTQGRAAPPTAARPEVDATLRTTLDAIGVPALVMTARWDVIAWNPLTAILRDYEALPEDRRNLLRLLLVEDDTYETDPAAYEAMARRVLSKFRVDYSQTAESFDFKTLIAELTARCPAFRRLWQSADVMTRVEGVAHYPQLGGINFEHSSYVPEGRATLRLVTYVPFDAESKARVEAFRRNLQPRRR